MPAAKHGEQRTNICVASRPANTPRQACSLGCIAKLRFAFLASNLHSGLAGQYHPYISSLQSTISSGCQHLPFRRQPANNLTSAVIFFTKQISAFRQLTSSHLLPIPAGKTANQSTKTTTKKQQKKGSRSFLRKITAETYRLLPHNVQQLRSFCTYKLHTKTRPSAGTSWRNISFRQNVLKTCRHRSLL